MRERLGTTPVENLLRVERNGGYHQVLEQMRSGQANFAALLIEGEPTTEQALEDKLLAVAESLGEPFLDEGETDSSKRVQTIIPNPKMAGEQVSSSSREELYLHVENAGMENMPDWVAIGCFRNNEGAETTLVDPVRVFKGLDQEQQRLLREQQYFIQEPLSFSLAGGRQERRRVLASVPIFDDTQSTRRPTVMADFEAMSSDSQPHREAFQAFLEAAREQSSSITLKPGSILVIRNTAVNNNASNDSQRYVMALHGRKPFEAQWGNPRVLKRVFVHGS